MPSPFNLPRLLTQALRRPLPLGLCHWRYLLPSYDARLRLHRRLWLDAFPDLPRPFAAVLQLIPWYRWVLCGAWRATFRAAGRLGAETSARAAIARPAQSLRLLRFALGWCVPPAAAYRFGLLTRPETVLDCIYDHETAAYHRLRNRERGVSEATVRLLQDKKAATTALAALSIPTAPTGRLVVRGDPTPIASHMGQERCVFCKTRSGSRGDGAFAAWVTAEGAIAGRGLDGRDLPDAPSVETAWRALLARDDALVQPRLASHPAMARLATGDDLVTVRFITGWRGETPGCLNCVLEIPAGPAPGGLTRYTLVPLDPADGRLLPLPEGCWRTVELEARVREVLERAGPMACVPGWSALAEASFRAQRRFPDLWAVAWDWGITPDGPLLLEGNIGWGLAVPQWLMGGLLATEWADQAGSPASSR